MSGATITVLGGTGKTGRRVAAQLSARADVTVRVASRRAPTTLGRPLDLAGRRHRG